MRQLFLFFSLFFILVASSGPTHAALMKFSFTGVINDVTNKHQSYWDPASLIGETVTGEFLMDTSSPIGGRLETGWYWWWVNDNEPPVLTSEISFTGNTYQLNNDGLYIEEFGGYVPNEYIAMTNGPDYDGGPVGDGEHLTDYARFNQETANGTLSSFLELEYSFVDYTRDFLTFPEQTTIPVEIPPDFEQVFTWTDDNLADDTEQASYGSLQFYQSLYDPDSGRETLFDSTVNFDLTRVEATLVSAPATIGLMLLASLVIFSQGRRKAA